MPAPSTPSKSKSWMIALPLATFLLVGAVWSGLWVFARGEVERGFDRWLVEEAQRGRTHVCGDRAVGGYPFRIEVSCARPSFVVETPEGRAEARLNRLTVVTMAYAWHHQIADLTGPLVVTQNGQDVVAVEFQRGQASYSSERRQFREFRLVLDKPTFGRAPGTRPEATAEQVLVAARKIAGTAEAQPDFDVALTLRQIAQAGARPDQAADLETVGQLRRWPLLGGGADGPVAAWARGGGTFDLATLRVTRGQGLVAANGRLGFNSNGRAQGAFEAQVLDSPALLGGISIPGIGEPGPFLGPALALVGRPVDVQGRRGTGLTIRVENGALGIGAIQSGIVFPPVF